MSKKRLIEGDIFYVKMKDKYIFARILLDVNTRILKKEPKHKMKFYSGTYLIEVYKGIYDKPVLCTDEIILPSHFTDKKCFYSKDQKVDWIFYEHRPIDYTQIDFPELLETGDDGFINFRKFDVSIPTKTLFKDFPLIDNLKINKKYTGSISFSFYGLADNALHFQGRDDLMRVEDRTYFLNHTDLRYNPKDRLDFYNQMNEDPNQSYYEFALKHGFDLARFY